MIASDLEIKQNYIITLKKCLVWERGRCQKKFLQDSRSIEIPIMLTKHSHNFKKYKMIRFFYPLLLVTLFFSGDVAGVSKNDEVSRCCFLFVKILSSQSKHKRLYVIVHHYLSSLL